MERATGIFVDGIGTAAVTSGVVSQLQGRMFALLYLHEGPLSLDEIAVELEQSKSNISVNIRGLIDWHLVRHTRVAGSRKDYYEAATDFWRAMQEIMERRFRWCVRVVLATADEAEHAATDSGGRGEVAEFVRRRLAGLRAFFAVIDAGLGAFREGQPIDPETLKKMVPLPVALPGQRRRGR